MALSDTKAKALKPRDKKYLEADEKGLYLEVKPNGTKRWVFRFRLHEKRCDLALGIYPDVGLAEARRARDEARKHVASGIDPRDVKRARKESALETARNSLAAVSEEWFAAKMAHLSKSSKRPRQARTGQRPTALSGQAPHRRNHPTRSSALPATH